MKIDKHNKLYITLLMIAVISVFTGCSKDSDGTKPDGGSTHDLKIGDYYYSDGTWSDGGLRGKNDDGTFRMENVAPDLKDGTRSVIGIVFQTDPSRIGAGEKAVLTAKGVRPRGLVMALTNASEGCKWGKQDLDEPDPFSNIAYANQMYRDLDGYNKTKTIVDKITSGDYDAATYAAFDAVSKYGTGESAQFAAPSTSTGWFLPGMGQWWDILVNLGNVNGLNYYQNRLETVDLGDEGLRTIKQLSVWLGRVSGSTPIKGTHWSSSENDGSYACCVNLESGGWEKLSLGLFRKEHSSYYYYSVRPVLAF